MGGTAFETAAAVPARWREYALATITPRFSWALPNEPVTAPKVLDVVRGDARSSAFSSLPMQGAAPTLRIDTRSGPASDTPGILPGTNEHLVALPDSGLQRTVVAPSITLPWSDHGDLRLTGVLAYQRFATLGFGLSSDGIAPVRPRWLGDSSFGVGGRVEVRGWIGQHLRWQLGYQSRVDMKEFFNYRGVYADRGDFDIPAWASAGLAVTVTPALEIDAGVQRVQYSRITPFTSSNLPTRFLALLGDSSSPKFAWRDLDVYSLGLTWHDADRSGNWRLRYTTRQQPVPTSRLLARALESAVADRMLSLGWTRAFGERKNSSFGILASYASSPYYLLMPTYVPLRDSTATRYEFEALWTTRF